MPFLMGQMLPGNTEYNFKGTLDEVKIYDRALTPDAVKMLYESSPTSTGDAEGQNGSLLLQPNPVFGTLTVRWPGGPGKTAAISVFDAAGRLVEERTAVTEDMAHFETGNWKSGIYIVVFKSDHAIRMARFVKM
ncbi:MAG TPA: T9SS type A sorting domain-containing protein [Saprospiraceae bacterium]|nr:T9SS type A sorting domain-containing protein [Saprospiraceae bacterium]